MTVHDVPAGRRPLTLSRRGFVGGAAGLGFAVCLGSDSSWLLAEADAKSANAVIGAWVRIAPDGRITIVTPAAEMGQGSMTGVPVALAEELDADWSAVTLEMAPAEPGIYGYDRGNGSRSMGIYGSRAMRSYFRQMRLAGAQVRKVLLQAAAEERSVDPSALTTEPGQVVHAPSVRRLTEVELA
jgi:isoquinoline 1-oxidoreductase beta subunit